MPYFVCLYRKESNTLIAHALSIALRILFSAHYWLIGTGKVRDYDRRLVVTLPAAAGDL